MSKKSILIVDDKEQIAKILYAYLHGDYDCMYKQNPVEALAWMQKGNVPI